MTKKQYEDIEISGEKVPVIWSGDVLVIGGSASGVAAGAASARKRVKTMVIERNSYLGGKVSDSPGFPIKGCFPGYVSLGGIMDELCAKLRFAKEDSAAVVDIKGSGVSYYHESEYFKWLSEDILTKSGCRWMLGMTVEKVLMEEGKIKGIIAVRNMKKYAFLAEMVIDATETGEIAEEGGAFQSGNESAGFYYPFILENVDTDVLGEYLKKDGNLEKAKAHARENGDMPDREGNVERLKVGIKEGKVYVDSVYLEEKVYAEMEDIISAAHRKVLEHICFYRKYVPGMESASLHRCSGGLIRELPGKIKGICQGKKNGYEKEGKFQGILRVEAETNGLKQIKLPLGMIISQKTDNLLVAGKTCDLEDDLRRKIGTGQEMVLGQCAGVCAATAVLREIMPKDLKEEEIHSTLDELGCDIDGNLSRPYMGDKIICELSEDGRKEAEA